MFGPFHGSLPRKRLNLSQVLHDFRAYSAVSGSRAVAVLPERDRLIPEPVQTTDRLQAEHRCITQLFHDLKDSPVLER